MKRRSFLELLSLASTALLPKTIFARESLPFLPEPPIEFINRLKGLPYIIENPPPFFQDLRPVFKITSIDGRIGFESHPHSVRANEHGYLLIPEDLREDPKATQYALYAPMRSFARIGPWYLIRTISRREARRARFTIVAPDYCDSDLIAKLPPSPYPDDHLVSMDFSQLPVTEGQTHWKVYGGSEPKSPASIIVEI